MFGTKSISLKVSTMYVFSHKGLRSAKSIINSDFSLVHTPTTLTLSSINFEARL